MVLKLQFDSRKNHGFSKKLPKKSSSDLTYYPRRLSSNHSLMTVGIDGDTCREMSKPKQIKLL